MFHQSSLERLLYCHLFLKSFYWFGYRSSHTIPYFRLCSRHSTLARTGLYRLFIVPPVIPTLFFLTIFYSSLYRSRYYTSWTIQCYWFIVYSTIKLTLSVTSENLCTVLISLYFCENFYTRWDRQHTSYPTPPILRSYIRPFRWFSYDGVRFTLYHWTLSFHHYLYHPTPI